MFHNKILGNHTLKRLHSRGECTDLVFNNHHVNRVLRRRRRRVVKYRVEVLHHIPPVCDKVQVMCVCIIHLFRFCRWRCASNTTRILRFVEWFEVISRKGRCDFLNKVGLSKFEVLGCGTRRRRRRRENRLNIHKFAKFLLHENIWFAFYR